MAADGVVANEANRASRVLSLLPGRMGVPEKKGERAEKQGNADQTARQTCQSLNDPDQFVFTYTRMMMGALYLNPHPRKILIIGLGGGVLPTALVKMFPDTRIDVVEIDPAVVKVARQFFGFNPDQRIQVFEEDGRVFVKRAGKSGRQYDLIMLDAFDHEYIPEHLLTQEFLFEVKALLTADGVLAANTFSTSRLYHHESTTYQAVFGPFYNLRVQMKNRIVLAKMDGLPPLDTIKAFADHGIVKRTIDQDVSSARETLSSLKAAGVNYDAATAQLEREGVDAFIKSFDDLLKALDEKLRAQTV